jgi:hypothetical protein
VQPYKKDLNFALLLPANKGMESWSPLSSYTILPAPSLLPLPPGLPPLFSCLFGDRCPQLE